MSTLAVLTLRDTCVLRMAACTGAISGRGHSLDACRQCVGLSDTPGVRLQTHQVHGPIPGGMYGADPPKEHVLFD